MITKQKAFNKSLVDENTQVIFMDEAHVGLLEPDDWKILTQGGLTAHDRKYKKSTPAVIRCPMFITCQNDMDFGDEHNDAMKARLRKFNFKSLTSSPVAGVQAFLKKHAMDCIVWAANMAVTPDDELPRPSTETYRGDEPFGEDEKTRIRNLTLDESDKDSDEDIADEPCTSQESEREESEREESEREESDRVNEEEVSSSYVDIWEKDLEMISKLREKEPPHSLKRRQLELIGASVKQLKEDCRNREEVRMAQFLEETKARWIAVGMLKEEDAHLLQTVDGPYHPNIEKTREEYFAKKKAEEERALKEKAKSYYEDEWVMAKEKELQDLQRKEDAATDPDTKRALAYVMGVAVDALKDKFQREDVPGLKKHVLLERRRVATELGWCSRDQAATIQSIWCQLPYPKEQESDEDDHEMFITQSTAPSQLRSQVPSQTSTPKKRTKNKGQLERVPKRARITNFFRPSQQE